MWFSKDGFELWSVIASEEDFGGETGVLCWLRNLTDSKQEAGK